MSLLAVACGLGTVAAFCRDLGGPPARPGGPASFVLLIDGFVHIAHANLGVVLGLLLGALLFGVPTALILAFNGVRVGWDLATLARGAPVDFGMMLLYAPIEYLGFVHAAAAGLQLGGRFFARVFDLSLPDGPPGTCRLTTLACVLVVIGAAVEAVVIGARMTG